MKSTNNTATCEVVLEHIEAFIDGDLPSEEAVLVETHIAVCRSCAEEVSFARELQHELHSFTTLECPDRVVEAVYRHIEQQQAPAAMPAPALHRPSVWQSLLNWFSSRRSPAFAPSLALGVVAVLIAGIWFFAGSPSETYSRAEIAEAKRQVEWTLAYLGSVNTRVAAVTTGDALQPYVVDPVQRAVEMAIETNASLE